MSADQAPLFSGFLSLLTSSLLAHALLASVRNKVSPFDNMEVETNLALLLSSPSH